MKAVSNLVVPYHPVSSSTPVTWQVIIDLIEWITLLLDLQASSERTKWTSSSWFPFALPVFSLSLSACYAPVEFRCKGERGADLNRISQPEHAEDVFCQVNLDSEDRIHGQIGYIYMVNSQVVLTHWTKPWATYICISDLYCSNFS